MPHTRLFCKLEFYGIRSTYLKWIKEFFTDRKQQVVIDNKFSTPSTVLSGVPQGSVLGPLLFQLFINDLSNGIDSLVQLYADDVLIMRSIITSDDHQTLQNDLIKLAHWSSTWQMPFNLAKCEHLTVTNKPHSSICLYKIYKYTLQRVDSIKCLGLTISHNLSWSPHISTIVGKANSVLAFFQRNFIHCQWDLKIKCYLTYAATVWSPHTQCTIIFILSK